MSKSTPPAPDYKGAAEQTAQSSKEVTNIQNFANRPDVNTPFGGQNWSTQAVKDPATGQLVTKWVQNNSLTPQAQGALDSQLAITRARSDIGKGMLDRVSSEYGPTMDWSQFQQAGGTPTAPGGNGQQYYDKAGDALYNKFSSRAEPQFARSQAALETQLRNRGLNPGDEAYDSGLNQMRQEQDDARQQANYAAIGASGSEAARMQGMDTNQFQNQIKQSEFQTTNRQQQIAEMMQKRGFSLNEINGLLTGQQVGMPTMPSFSQAGRSDTTNYSGAAQNQYSAAQDAANAKNAAIGNAVGAVSGIAGAFM